MKLTIEFVRIGRNHYVPPLTCECDTANEARFADLISTIYAYADRFLASRHYVVDVTLDPETGEGDVLFDGGRFGRGTISPQPEGDTDAPERLDQAMALVRDRVQR